MTFSHIRHKPAHYIVTFFHIRHRWIKPLWHSIKFVMDEELIVQSTWIHLLYFAYVAWIYHVGPTCQICTEKTFFYYRNIILCHLRGPHDTLASGWPTCQLSLGWIFLDETQNGAKPGFEPTTIWSIKAFTTRLLFQLCCYVSRYFFVLCSVHWFCPVNMVLGPTYQVESAW
jgi:hypothetical protein